MKIEMTNCANCGAAVDPQGRQCQYCKSYLKDPISNHLYDMAFRIGYPSSANCSGYAVASTGYYPFEPKKL